MKMSRILMMILFCGQILGLKAHAEIDPATIEKAKKWAAEQDGKVQPGPELQTETQPQPPIQTPKVIEPPVQPQVVAEPVVTPKTEVSPKFPKVPEALKPVVASDIGSTTLNYQTVVDIGSYKGTTFFSLMQKVIKPALDRYADEGFYILNGAGIVNVLERVDKKVARNAIAAAGTVERLQSIADKLAASGTRINFHNLPAAIGQIDPSVSRFDLQEFFGLASGGGVAVRVMDGVYAYNVNYGTGLVQMDAQSGRSFGEAAGRLARDASDADYLQMLERYVRSSGTNIASFYQSILEILTNNDVSGFSKISKEGQIVASDFLAVYVAEQDRHLMVNLQAQHWDRALLEVTLLSAFHAGQDQVYVMYNDRLTNTTYKQARNCIVPNVPPPQKVAKTAGMIDYWQFSSNTDEKNCKRSGINLTNQQFRKLGRLITQYERQAHPQLVKEVERHLDGIQLSDNLLADLSNFLIRYKTPTSLDAKTLELPADFTRFLMQVRADANAITGSILQSQ
jgi:hypothetical protein